MQPAKSRQIHSSPVGPANGYAARRIFCRTMSAARLPIMIVAALVLSDTTVGMIDESATRKP